MNRNKALCVRILITHTHTHIRKKRKSSANMRIVSLPVEDRYLEGLVIVFFFFYFFFFSLIFLRCNAFRCDFIHAFCFRLNAVGLVEAVRFV